MFTMFLTGAGLASAAGLNAYLPLLILALADRTTTVISLPSPYNILSSNTGLIVLLVLLPLELIPDKIAKIDHLNDLIQTAIRPGAAAFAFMAVIHQNEHLHLVWGLIFGLLIGGAVHWLKASSRPGISRATRGIGNPIISLLEDLLSGLLAIVAIFLPVGVLALLPLGLWYLNRTYRRVTSGESRLVSAFRPAMNPRPAQPPDES